MRKCIYGACHAVIVGMVAVVCVAIMPRESFGADGDYQPEYISRQITQSLTCPVDWSDQRKGQYLSELNAKAIVETAIPVGVAKPSQVFADAIDKQLSSRMQLTGNKQYDQLTIEKKARDFVVSAKASALVNIPVGRNREEIVKQIGTVTAKVGEYLKANVPDLPIEDVQRLQAQFVHLMQERMDTPLKYTLKRPMTNEEQADLLQRSEKEIVAEAPALARLIKEKKVEQLQGSLEALFRNMMRGVRDRTAEAQVKSCSAEEFSPGYQKMMAKLTEVQKMIASDEARVEEAERAHRRILGELGLKDPVAYATETLLNRPLELDAQSQAASEEKPASQPDNAASSSPSKEMTRQADDSSKEVGKSFGIPQVLLWVGVLMFMGGIFVGLCNIRGYRGRREKMRSMVE